MRVRDFGAGKPIVLLHSLLADSGSFEAFAAGLSSAQHVLTVDLPGYRGTPSSADAIPEVALGVAEALRGAGVDSDFDLVGNGYGGFVALSMAQQLSSRVDRLVLLGSAASFAPEGKAAIRIMKEAVDAGGMPAVLDIALQRLFPPDFRQQKPDVVGLCSERLLAMDPVAFASTCSNLINVDLRSDLNQVNNKTLVVVGLEDRATPTPLARELAKGIAGARLHELPDCGHAPHIQMPNVLMSLLQDFLGS
jgi:3-oxoadipate enol-lactonase